MLKHGIMTAAILIIIALAFVLQPAAYADYGITDVYFAGIKYPPLDTPIKCGNGTALIRREGDRVVIELNNAEITEGTVINSVDGFAAIKSNENLTVILNGSNVIRAEGHRFTYGIVADNNDLVIKGGGSLRVLSSCAFSADESLSGSFGISTKGITIEDSAVEIVADSRPAQAFGKEAYAVALDSKSGDLVIKGDSSVTASAKSDTYYAKAVGCLKTLEIQSGSLEAYSESNHNSANNSALFMDTGSHLRLCGGRLYLQGENRAATVRSADISGGMLFGSDSTDGPIKSPVTHDVSSGSFTVGGKRALRIQSEYHPVKVTFDANGGTSSKAYDYVTPGNKYAGLLPSAVRAGFTFEGWYTQPENGDRVDSSSFVSACGDYTLYAHWSGEAVLTLDAQGGECEEKALTVPLGSACGELPVPALTGHTFDGWYTSDGTKVTSDCLFNESCTLYARYTPKQYTVTFDARGGRVSESFRIVGCGSAVGELPVPTRDGYSFTGWYDKNETKITSDFVVTDNLTLFAKWEAVPIPCIVYFDGRGGAISFDSKNCIKGEKYGSMPSASREGFVFLGWYTDPDAGVKIYENSVVNSEGSQTLYAHWEKEKPVIKSVYAPDMELVFRKLYKINYTVSTTGETDVKVMFESSDESVAAVTSVGMIRGLKRGEADITVTAVDEWGNTVSSRFHVTVRYAWWQWLIMIFLFGFIWYR